MVPLVVDHLMAALDGRVGTVVNDDYTSCPMIPRVGCALCVAGGEGCCGVWLAEQGWEVVSIDFSDMAPRGAAAPAARRGVSLTLVEANVHTWDCPVAAIDLVVVVFSQFRAPAERDRTWAGMRRAVKPDGWLTLQGYTPDQLHHRAGGPSDPTHLYTEQMLRAAFSDFEDLQIIEEETTLEKGSGHRDTSAVIGPIAGRGP